MTISAAKSLEGVKLSDEWTVVSRVEHPEDHSGARSSVGYLARHSSGILGYVKALDYGAILESVDPAREMQRATEFFNAERDLLTQCGEKRLSRIVRVHSSGTTRIENASPAAVSYLIFERADGDAADVRGSIDAEEFLPMLALAHHAGVALMQLHGIGAAHQDVKPSNLLTWATNAGHEGKLGDLGSAYLPGRPCPNDDEAIPGDCFHAPPEQQYGDPQYLPSDRRRQAADIFMLGDLVAFLLTGVTYNAVVTKLLDPSQRWWTWQGTFREVLPALVDAHGRALQRFQEAVHCDISELVYKMLDELCYPDPTQRGDPAARRLGKSQYSLHRYVTRLDLIRRRAELAVGRRLS